MVKCLQVVPIHCKGLEGLNITLEDFKIHKGPRGIETCTFHPKTYLSNVCEQIEKLMEVMLKSYKTPMATGDIKRVVTLDSLIMMNTPSTGC